ncbi:MAG: ABC transporter ATP-binding protein [Bacteroidales bacterium]|nr:ABC transporter ATP-binding protein [Bacteroidales bacterium]
MSIEYNKIRFSYNGRDVLKNLSGTFQKGKFSAVVGPNGSGKSTFLKCLDRLLKPKEGSILIDGKSLDQYPGRDLAKKIGFVQQSAQSVFANTVFNTVLLGRKPYMNWRPGSNDEKITEDILKEFHLESLAMRSIDEISGGERQRVYIARAMAQQPEILLLDEPTSNLDIKYQFEIMELLKKVCRKEVTVIMAIHDLNLAIRYADQFILLKEGEILAMGNRDIITEKNLEKLYSIKFQKITTRNTMYIIPD